MNKWRGLARSFQVAFIGIGCCILRERNMRIHLCVALGVVLLSCFYDFTAVERAVLLLACGLVIAGEMFNTAVERMVDFFSPQYSSLARLAKDIAAGAVLVCAVTAAGVGAFLFFDLQTYTRILAFASAHILEFLAGVTAYFLFTVCFVFLPNGKRRD